MFYCMRFLIRSVYRVGSSVITLRQCPACTKWRGGHSCLRYFRAVQSLCQPCSSNSPPSLPVAGSLRPGLRRGSTPRSLATLRMVQSTASRSAGRPRAFIGVLGVHCKTRTRCFRSQLHRPLRRQGTLCGFVQCYLLFKPSKCTSPHVGSHSETDLLPSYLPLRPQGWFLS